MRRYEVTIRGRGLEALHRRLAGAVDACLDGSIDGGGSDGALTVLVSASSEAAAEKRVVASLPDGCWVEHVEESAGETPA